MKKRKMRGAVAPRASPPQAKGWLRGLVPPTRKQLDAYAGALLNLAVVAVGGLAVQVWSMFTTPGRIAADAWGVLCGLFASSVVLTLVGALLLSEKE